MHKGELCYGQPFRDHFPVSERVDLPLEWPYEPHCNDVRELFLLKSFDELFQVEPAVGDNSQYLDVGVDTLIGIGEEGNDVIPGDNVAG
jgi:hypothetical protein